jgi:hypothetical protein
VTKPSIVGSVPGGGAFHAKQPRTGEQLVEIVFATAAHYFPRLAEAAESSEAQG